MIDSVGSTGLFSSGPSFPAYNDLIEANSFCPVRFRLKLMNWRSFSISMNIVAQWHDFFFSRDQHMGPMPSQTFSFHSPKSSRGGHGFLEGSNPLKRHGETQGTYSFNSRCPLSWWHGGPNFVGSTRTIDFVLSPTFVSNIAALVHRFWCCQIFYWLTFIHHHFHHFTAHDRENHPLLLVFALKQSNPACPLANFGVFYPWVLLTVLQSLPLGNEAWSWTHPTAKCPALSIVNIVCFIARNLNFNNLAKFEI